MNTLFLAYLIVGVFVATLVFLGGLDRFMNDDGPFEYVDDFDRSVVAKFVAYMFAVCALTTIAWPLILVNEIVYYLLRRRARLKLSQKKSESNY